MAEEQTLVIIRPNGVHRNLVAEIIKRFEQKGYRLTGLKFAVPTQQQAEEHYKDHQGSPFFTDLIKCMLSGPSVILVWSGQNAVSAGRALIGETDPQKSAPGTIRGDYAITISRNLIHGSDSTANAQREIALWFKPEELVSWVSCQTPWLYE